MEKSNGNGFFSGLRDGVPIGLGYLSVSFSFGLMAVTQDLSVLSAVLISMTNLTSAGQVAGLTIIAAGGSLAEMALAQLIINLRYALMSISLSQKLDSSFNTPKRLAVSFGITDEIFAVASAREGTVSPRYMAGLILVPFVCWSSGTLIGALAGNVLPEALKAALGLAIYGMFLAIIIPPARKSVGVLSAVIMAAALSCCIRFIPVFSGISQGFSVIICAVAASAAAALLFPVKKEARDE